MHMNIRAAILGTHSWINLGFEEVMIVVLVLDDGWAYSNSIWLRLFLLLAVVFMFMVTFRQRRQNLKFLFGPICMVAGKV